MLYVIGKSVASYKKGVVWEMMGVFTDEQKAVALCEGHADWFIGPIEQDSLLPIEATEWPGSYFPSEIKARTNSPLRGKS